MSTAAVLDLPAYLVLSDLDTITAVELAARITAAQAAVVKAQAEGRRNDAAEAKRSIRMLEGETRRRAVPVAVAAAPAAVITISKDERIEIHDGVKSTVGKERIYSRVVRIRSTWGTDSILESGSAPNPDAARRMAHEMWQEATAA